MKYCFDVLWELTASFKHLKWSIDTLNPYDLWASELLQQLGVTQTNAFTRLAMEFPYSIW